MSCAQARRRVEGNAGAPAKEEAARQQSSNEGTQAGQTGTGIEVHLPQATQADDVTRQQWQVGPVASLGSHSRVKATKADTTSHQPPCSATNCNFSTFALSRCYINGAKIVLAC